MNTSTMCIERLRYLLDCDADTGALIWRNPTSNRVRAGQRAGFFGRNALYRQVRLDGKLFIASRLVWAHVTGAWPSGLIDHVSRDKSDDRFTNLRECDKSQNGANRARQRNNKLGIKGVRIRKDTGRFAAAIGVRGKVRGLGSFDTAEEAHAAYALASANAFGEYAHTPFSPNESRDS